MEKVGLNNSDIKDKPYKIELDDSIEILTTDDKRLKIVGEELSNDTGRSILTKLFDGHSNISDIATELNLSIPLVSWHIQRLVKIGLVKISKTEFSSKNKKVYHYTPTKFVLVIVPSIITKKGRESQMLKILSKKFYGKLSTLVAFIVSTLSLYLIQRSTNITYVSLSDPEAAATNLSLEFLIPFLGGGALTAIFVLIRLLWWKQKLRN